VSTSKTAHRHISQDMLRELLVKYFVADGFVGVTEFCGDIGTLILHRLILYFGGYVKNYVYVDKIRDLNSLKART
jgi:hypothetical protein